MKTIFSALVISAAMLAGTNTAKACGDSTHVKKEIRFGHYFGTDRFMHWEGLDLGVNGWLNRNNTIAIPETWKSMELDYARSWSVALNMKQFNMSLYKRYISLGTGFGVEWNNYSFRNNISMLTDAPVITTVDDTIDYAKNKLKTFFVNVPLMLDFNTSEHSRNNFHVSVGAKFGYNVFRNRQKQVYYENGEKQRIINRDDYLVNPFRTSLTARVGYGKYTVFADYALTSMFRENKGPEVYPFSVGLHLAL